MAWKNMTEAEKIGENIRYLRELHGETLEQLGCILNVSRKAVSNYENGRQPPKEKLSRIADHFMVTIDSLFHSDFSWCTTLGKLDYSINDLWECIPALLPLIYCGWAMKNDHYRRAFDKHKQFYGQIKKADLSTLGMLDSCIDEYIAALEDESIRNEVGINMLALWHFFMFLCRNVPDSTMLNSAQVAVAAKSNRIAKAVNDTEPNPCLKKAAMELETILQGPEIINTINDFIRTLKNDSQWSDLAYYYLSLQYAWNITNNNLGASQNRMIGMEMLKALSFLDNSFACQYFDSINGVLKTSKCPRFVDTN